MKVWLVFAFSSLIVSAVLNKRNDPPKKRARISDRKESNEQGNSKILHAASTSTADVARATPLSLPPSPMLASAGPSLRHCNPNKFIGKLVANKYFVEKLIHSTDNGVVLQAQYNNVRYALKCHKHPIGTNPQKDRETRILARLDHPNVIKIMETVVYENELLLVMELYPKDLFDGIVDGDVKEYMVRPVFDKILDAVIYIHHKGIYHRDIKPENIVIKGSIIPNPVLIDFDASTEYKTSGDHESVGTPLYMSPEMLAKKPGVTWESNDIWSLGILLIVMLEKKQPFEANTMNFNQVEMLKQEFGYTEEFMGLLRQVFGPADGRPSALNFKQVLSGLGSLRDPS